MKKVFKYGDWVRVKRPRRRAFFGTVYSEYTIPNQMRRICVNLPDGSGVGYPVCYVTHTKTNIKIGVEDRPTPTLPPESNMKIQADTRAHQWSSYNGRSCTFWPNGKLYIVGEEAQENPKVTWAARLFVGLNVGGKPKWKIDDVVKVVRRIRTAQGHSPNLSFIAQKGIFRSSDTGKVVEEDSVQIIIIGSGESKAEFGEDMLLLAEEIASALKQEKVVVEIQRNGISVETYGVAPKAKPKRGTDR